MQTFEKTAQFRLFTPGIWQRPPTFANRPIFPLVPTKLCKPQCLPHWPAPDAYCIPHIPTDVVAEGFWAPSKGAGAGSSFCIDLGS